jgi:hypothetical protein
MAKTTKTPDKSDNLTPFPVSESSVAIAEPPEPRDTAVETLEPVPQLAQSAPKGPGRPKKTDESPQSDFFQQVASVRPSDWGTRIYLYLYQLEPVCDLKKSGGKAYLMRYEEPITDEHRVMLEQGSGRYRFILAKNKISPEASNEVARYEFEIFNRNYPPKLVREAWVPDPRNRRWEALLPKEPEVKPAAAAETVMDAIRLGVDLAKENRADPVQITTPVATPVDPWSAAEKILNMRSDNPMVEIMKAQMEAQAKALEAERERQFKAAEAAKQREFELQKELTTARSGNSIAPKGLIDQITELAGVADKLEPLKKLFGWGSPNGTSADGGSARHVKTTILDLVGDHLPKVLDAFSPLIQVAAHKIMNPALAVNGTHAQSTTTVQVPGTDAFQEFLRTVATPKMLMYFRIAMHEKGPGPQVSGENLADLIYGLFPEHFENLQKFTHPMLPGLSGPAAIITAYRNAPSVWAEVGPNEAKFSEFVHAFCAWKPDTDEDEVLDAEVVEGPEDLDSQLNEERPS